MNILKKTAIILTVTVMFSSAGILAKSSGKVKSASSDCRTGQCIHNISVKNISEMNRELKKASSLSCSDRKCLSLKLGRLNSLLQKAEKMITDITEYDHADIFRDSQRKWEKFLESAVISHLMIYSDSKDPGSIEGLGFRISMTEERISSIISYYSDYAEELAFEKGYMGEN